jgi:tRNA (adenine57-N1/adenine58-N1)-methyltransferase catalytic subunit
MYETLIRPHEVNQIPTLLPIGEVSEKLKKAEQKREEKRLRQIANARSNSGGKRKRGDAVDGEAMEGAEDTGNKRVKTDDEDDTGSQIDVEVPEVNRNHPQSVQTVRLSDTTSGEVQPTDAYMSTATKINVSKAMPEVRGHTSYLTFACLVPAASSEDTVNIIVKEVGSDV